MFMGLLLAFPSLDPFKTLVYSIPFNFYAILTLIFVFWIALSGKEFGEMKRFTDKQKNSPEASEIASGGETSSPVNMVLPILTMVITMPFFLMYSGWDASLSVSLSEAIWNSISNGSGSEAVLNACFAGFLDGYHDVFLSKNAYHQNLHRSVIQRNGVK